MSLKTGQTIYMEYDLEENSLAVVEYVRGNNDEEVGGEEEDTGAPDKYWVSVRMKKSKENPKRD